MQCKWAKRKARMADAALTLKRPRKCATMYGSTCRWINGTLPNIAASALHRASRRMYATIFTTQHTHTQSDQAARRCQVILTAVLLDRSPLSIAWPISTMITCAANATRGRRAHQGTCPIEASSLSTPVREDAEVDDAFIANATESDMG